MPDDTIMTIRLETLKACLDRASDKDWWLEKLIQRPEEDDPITVSEEQKTEERKAEERKTEERKAEERDFEDFLNEFFTEIRGRLNAHSTAVVKALKDSPSSAWAGYAKLDLDTVEIFRECFDCLGGRYLRNRHLEGDNCKWADALFQPWSRRYSTRAFPTAQETLPLPLRRNFRRRIIRLRLPGSIWAIPYLAHEYGHFLTEDNNQRELQDCKDAQIRRILNEDHEVAKLAVPGDRQSAAEELVHELFADVFGTFLLGPSYACSALTMKLDPFTRGGPAESLLIDNKRAWVILWTLQSALDNLGAAAPQGLKELVKWLWDGWNEALIHAEVPGMATDCYLRELAGEIAEMFGNKWDEYKYFGQFSGWKFVEKWGNLLVSPNEIGNPDGGVLADAFNASWYARFRIISGRRVSQAEPLTPDKAVDELNMLSIQSVKLYDDVWKYEQSGRRRQRGGKPRSGPSSGGIGPIA